MTIGERREAVRDAGRDEHALLDVAVEVEAHRGAFGLGALTQIVQHNAGPAGHDVPVVGLVQVVVEPDDRPRGADGAVALQHLAPGGAEPVAPVRLDEAAAMVAMDVGLDEHDAVDVRGVNELRHRG